MNSVAAMVAALLCIAHGSVETCMAPKRARHVLAGTGAEGDFELVLKEETVATGRWSGNKLWPGALALLGRLSELAPRAPRARVLELGCGLPLLAAALAQLGAEVCATDHPSVMDQVRAAVKEELIEGLSSSAIQRLRFEPLQWGEPLNLTPCGFQAVDLIVGADLVYDGFPVDALYQSLKELMGMYSGTVMLALQPRRFPMTAALPFGRAASVHCACLSGIWGWSLLGLPPSCPHCALMHAMSQARATPCCQLPETLRPRWLPGVCGGHHE
ncbi:unnamed protein product [Effrenium voratum]|nr:unnamed protein product [Effrenium voratum]